MDIDLYSTPASRAATVLRLALASLIALAFMSANVGALAQNAPQSQTSAGAQTAPVAAPAPDIGGPVENKPESAASPIGRQETTTTAGAVGSLPSDLSPWSMFLHADIVVKAVMVGLAFASVVTWTVWLAKGFELVFAKRRARAATLTLRRAASLGAAAKELRSRWTRKGAVADLVEEATIEERLSEGLSADGVKERLAIELSRIEARAGRGMAHGTGLLATIGATAPFVGLFGTVWGIMNAFIGISKSHTTNLAVVAPGIAEALLATAIGLVAAIPAVIIYNLFARSIAGYRALLSDASAAVLRHVSRDLERRQSGAASFEAVSTVAERSLRFGAALRPAE